MSREKASFIFSALLFIVFCWAAYEATTFRDLAKPFPLYIALLGAFFILVDMLLKFIKQMKIKRGQQVAPDQGDAMQDEPIENTRGVIKYSFFIVFYLVVIYLVGFIVGTIIYLSTFLYFESKFGLIKTAISVTVVIIAITTFGNFMNLYWPKGLINIF